MRNIKPLENSVIPSSASLSHEKVFSFILLSAGMLSILAWRGAGYFDDTVQYITMHIRREPVYPLYLAFFRFFFGSSDQPGVTGKAGLMVSTSQWELFGLDFYPGIAASTNHLSLASCSVSRSLILRILSILAAAGVAIAARGTAMAALIQAAGISGRSPQTL